MSSDINTIKVNTIRVNTLKALILSSLCLGISATAQQTDNEKSNTTEEKVLGSDEVSAETAYDIFTQIQKQKNEIKTLNAQIKNLQQQNNQEVANLAKRLATIEQQKDIDLENSAKNLEQVQETINQTPPPTEKVAKKATTDTTPKKSTTVIKPVKDTPDPEINLVSSPSNNKPVSDKPVNDTPASNNNDVKKTPKPSDTNVKVTVKADSEVEIQPEVTTTVSTRKANVNNANVNNTNLNNSVDTTKTDTTKTDAIKTKTDTTKTDTKNITQTKVSQLMIKNQTKIQLAQQPTQKSPIQKQVIKTQDTPKDTDDENTIGSQEIHVEDMDQSQLTFSALPEIQYPDRETDVTNKKPVETVITTPTKATAQPSTNSSSNQVQNAQPINKVKPVSENTSAKNNLNIQTNNPSENIQPESAQPESVQPENKQAETFTPNVQQNTIIKPTPPKNPVSIYLRALQAYSVEQTDVAISELNTYVSLYPNGPLVAKSHYWLGESYLQKEPANYATARYHFLEVANHYRDHPKNDKIAKALYRLSQLSKINNYKEDLIKYTNRLKKEFPNSIETKLIEGLLKS